MVDSNGIITNSIPEDKPVIPEELVRVEHVSKFFATQSGFFAHLLTHGKIPMVKAVDDVSFSIYKGEVFGLAGESGSGKSTLGRLVLRLLKATSGKVLFDGIDLGSLSSEEMRKTRARMQIVFQDPLASLNPRMTLGQSIEHPAKIHSTELSQSERRNKVLEILEDVGMNPPTAFYDLFPHQISGGQRQRIVLARALITNPSFIVADEPVAMADVSVRALLLDLMMKLKEEFDLTYLFITHDLATAKYICNRIAILYLGKLCEVGSVEDVYQHTIHPYTNSLLAAVPVPDPLQRRTKPMPPGEIPSAIDPPSGCHFHPRCPFAQEICSVEEPALREMTQGHWVACHFSEQFQS
ncbi:MAG: ABC transporter ATP-binding protein [Anaerolineaceae bacterium]|nr:ABC transporter ATP-binding protein [Anaerolineaceae bacterium]